ncbi:MAG TPA: helicase-related protein [Hyphomicrobiaceae bacterium]|nr:helicase-related protein [Hyphomicrobiaceae bacterium]
MSLDIANRIRNVTAVLGPTNTGKTHLAIERMLGHDTGLIGLPLRLLAREVYDKITARVGVDRVALITGEEKIKPEHPRYWVCTVEAMPRTIDADFLAIDEIQLAADPDRGHVFTDRLLHARGKQETLMLGAQTMREAISDLIPGANFISRPRLSKLSYAGEKKLTRLPPRSAVVAFSAGEVYAVAELIRRQRGGAAVVLGALSPRTRNAQVALYQSGDVDFLVATDAIGMGLNLNVEHVAFAGVRKFDGQVNRGLTPAELGQIAGRAGRHMNDGTFGVTGTVEAFGADLIERLETHTFDTVRILQWRSRDLDFGSLDRLRDSLRQVPREGRLTRARMADDVTALENVCHDHEIAALAVAPAAVSRLWEVCQIPDYRKISPQNHAELVATLYKFLLAPAERIPEDWFANQVAFADRTDGDIDTLANRIAHIRTWTFVSNRSDWLVDPEHWQGRTRAIEDSLSDALHERLTQRFVDRRTSALMRGLKEKDELYAEIADDGTVQVERHFVGRLKGFRFYADTQAEGIHGKAARNAASHVLAKELGMRVRRVVAAKNEAFKLTRQGQVMWRDEEIAALEAGEDALKPTISVLADDHLPAADREKVRERLTAWLGEICAERLKPLLEITAAPDISGLARGIAFRLKEDFGVLRRDSVSDEIRLLDQPARAQLRKYGVRFGAFNIYFPMLLKPASTDLATVLWTLKHGTAHGLDIARLPPPPRPGLTSLIADAALPEAFYRVAGYHLCGPRAVRIDMLERLSDLIRPLVAWRVDPNNPAPPPKGATGDGGFRTTSEMMSILGCSATELGNVLKVLGFRLDRRRVDAAAAAPASLPAPAETTPLTTAATSTTVMAETAADGEPAAAEAQAAEPTPAQAEATETAPAEAEAAEAAPAEAQADELAPLEAQMPATVPAEAAAHLTGEATAGGTEEPEAIAAVAGASAEAIGELPAAAPEAAKAQEEMFEDIWRPRRRGRDLDQRPERGRPARRRPGADAPVRAPAGEVRKERPDQRQRRRDKRPKERYEERPRNQYEASPPKTKTAGFDPNSPFAALYSLKAAMDKRTQD